jgi:hypothetical protein
MAKEDSKLGQIIKATVVAADNRLSKFLESDVEEERKIAREELISGLNSYCAENLKHEL